MSNRFRSRALVAIVLLASLSGCATVDSLKQSSTGLADRAADEVVDKLDAPAIAAARSVFASNATMILREAATGAAFAGRTALTQEDIDDVLVAGGYPMVASMSAGTAYFEGTLNEFTCSGSFQLTGEILDSTCTRTV